MNTVVFVDDDFDFRTNRHGPFNMSPEQMKMSIAEGRSVPIEDIEIVDYGGFFSIVVSDMTLDYDPSMVRKGLY